MAITAAEGAEGIVDMRRPASVGRSMGAFS